MQEKIQKTPWEKVKLEDQTLRPKAKKNLEPVEKTNFFQKFSSLKDELQAATGKPKLN